MVFTNNDERMLQDKLRCMRPGRNAVMAVFLAWLGGCGSFGNKVSEDAFDDGNKSWQEVALKLPPVPKASDLLPFDVGAATTQRFALDARSVDLGSDGVIRYTLVAVSSSDVKNVSYEGIRCESHEQKIYALGHEDGTWSQARRSEWQPILNNAANRQQGALAQDYFCTGKSIAGSADDMLRRLRRHEPLTNEYTR